MRKIAFALALIMLSTVLFSACDMLENSALFEDVLQQYQNGEQAATATKEEATAVGAEKDKKPTPNKNENKKDPAETEQGKNPNQDKEPDKEQNKEPGANEPQFPIDPSLPSLDYQGKEIVIMMPADAPNEFYLDGASSVISSDLYARDIKVEEMLNVCLVLYITGNGMQDYQKDLEHFRADVIAGVGEFDMVLGSDRLVSRAVCEGLYVDMLGAAKELAGGLSIYETMVPSSILQDLTLSGKLYTITGPMSYSYLENLPVLFYNRDMFANMFGSYENLANVALDGAWTVERFYQILNQCYMDLNGDGTKNEYDFYGLVASLTDLGYLAGGMNMRVTEKDALDLPINVLNGNMRNVHIVDALREIVMGESCFVINSEATKRDLFYTERALFMVGGLGAHPEELKQYSINYGVLPLPMLEKTDGVYVTVPGSKTVYYGISAGSFDSQAALTTLVCVEITEKALMRNMPSEDAYDMAKMMLSNSRMDFLDAYMSYNVKQLVNRTVVNDSQTYETWVAQYSGSIDSKITSFRNAMI